jgi:hypothetical protein
MNPVQKKMKKELLQCLQESHQTLAHCNTMEETNHLRARLEHLINELIQHDFGTLVQWLYRIDVDEKKIKAALASEVESNASTLLATLMIERQLQKIQYRSQFTRNDNIPDEERW